MPDENKPDENAETETITEADVGSIDDLDLSEPAPEADPVENTGAGEPVDSIEAAADAAAVDEPPVETPPEPEPTPEPEPEVAAKPVAAGKAPATKRTRQTAGKRGKDTAANVQNLAVRKDARQLAEPVPITEEAQAKIDLKIVTRERLREIKDEIAAAQADIDVLILEQETLANPSIAADTMTFVERHQQVLKRSTELRAQRHNDRLKLLAQGAGKSPLDRAMGDGPRKSMAAADASNSENE